MLHDPVAIGHLFSKLELPAIVTPRTLLVCCMLRQASPRPGIAVKGGNFMEDAKEQTRDQQEPKGELADKELEGISGGPISGFINETGTTTGTATTGTTTTDKLKTN